MSCAVVPTELVLALVIVLGTVAFLIAFPPWWWTDRKSGRVRAMMGERMREGLRSTPETRRQLRLLWAGTIAVALLNLAAVAVTGRPDGARTIALLGMAAASGVAVALTMGSVSDARYRAALVLMNVGGVVALVWLLSS